MKTHSDLLTLPHRPCRMCRPMFDVFRDDVAFGLKISPFWRAENFLLTFLWIVSFYSREIPSEIRYFTHQSRHTVVCKSCII